MAERVLVVDLDPDFARALVALLDAEGFDPVVVVTGADTLSQVLCGGVSLVLLEVLLPDMNGVEVVRSASRRRI